MDARGSARRGIRRRGARGGRWAHAPSRRGLPRLLPARRDGRDRASRQAGGPRRQPGPGRAWPRSRKRAAPSPIGTGRPARSSRRRADAAMQAFLGGLPDYLGILVNATILAGAVVAAYKFQVFDVMAHRFRSEVWCTSTPVGEGEPGRIPLRGQLRDPQHRRTAPQGDEGDAPAPRALSGRPDHRLGPDRQGVAPRGARLRDGRRERRGSRSAAASAASIRSERTWTASTARWSSFARSTGSTGAIRRSSRGSTIPGFR